MIEKQQTHDAYACGVVISPKAVSGPQGAGVRSGAASLPFVSVSSPRSRLDQCTSGAFLVGDRQCRPRPECSQRANTFYTFSNRVARAS